MSAEPAGKTPFELWFECEGKWLYLKGIASDKLMLYAFSAGQLSERERLCNMLTKSGALITNEKSV